jgi:signal transduction histidine kinase
MSGFDKEMKMASYNVRGLSTSVSQPFVYRRSVSLDPGREWRSAAQDRRPAWFQGMVGSTRALRAPAPLSLEQDFANLMAEVAPARGARVQVFVQGKPRTLNPAVQEEVFLIGREAVINALRHSEATSIEVEIQYLCDRLRVFVRDDGCGIDPNVVQQAKDSHWGLSGMRERTRNIGAQFEIWSRPGAGTEVRVAVSANISNSGN